MRFIPITIPLLFLVNGEIKADLLKAEAGVGAWYIKSTGDVSYKGTAISLDDELGLDSTVGTYVWANFKHFIPVIPNARVEVTQIGTDATNKLPTGIKKIFNDYNLTGKDVESKLSLNQIDAIVYYNLLDTLITFDVGVGVKYYSGTLDINNKNLDIDFPIPLIYGRLATEIPFTNFGAEMDLKYFRFDPLVDAEMFDFRIKANATIISLALLDVNLEIGYRVHRLQIFAGKNSFSGFNANIKSEVSGFFGGLNIAF